MLLKATIDTVAAMEAVKPKDPERVIVDTTVQEKAIAHPVNSRLLEIARHKVVSAAKRAGIQLKQTFAKEGKAKACAGRRVATPMPSSSGACNGCSNASARFLASSSERCNAKCIALTLRPITPRP
jgi:hypothetical protein